MEIVCGNCNAKLSVPDEKIPRDQRVSLTCPKCQHKVFIEPSGHSENGERLDSSGPGELSEAMEGFAAGEDTRDVNLQFYADDEKLALILHYDVQARELLAGVASELGYRPLMENDAREALKKMRLYIFDLVLLSDGFDNAALEQSPVMAHINTLSMSVRRRMFLVLFSERFKTMDRMTAFLMSANLVVNRDDMGNLSRIMDMAIAENDRFYKVFKDTLKDLGQS